MIVMHQDIPYFFGATKDNIPKWLLACMRESRLFDDRILRQLQGIVHINPYLKPEDEGEFYFFPEGTQGPRSDYKLDYNKALIVDGSEIAHGGSIFKP